MAELCSSELTRSNSDAASSLTAENSGDVLPFPSANAKPDKCPAWTNEMHNKYLDSLEATFVQQLLQSSGSLAWCTEQNRSGKDSLKRLPVSVNNTSEQFAVLQDGKWQKRIFTKDDRPLSYISTIKIPRMHCKRRAEGSGQNFVDGDYEDDTNGNSSAKRLKTAVEYSSSEDQSVPSGKIPALGKSIGSNSTLAGQANREDSSKRF